MVDVFRGCSKTWELLFIMSITSGSDLISEGSARCVRDKLPDDAAHIIFVGELVRAYDDPSQPAAQLFGELVQPLVAAYAQCLTPEELGRVDWS